MYSNENWGRQGFTYFSVLQNIDCGYSLEPPRRSIRMFLSKNNIEKKYQNFSVENFQFLKLKKSLFIACASLRNGVTTLETPKLMLVSYTGNTVEPESSLWNETKPYFVTVQ